MSIRFAQIDGCAVPRAYFPVFRKLKAKSGCTYNSIDREDAAAGILHKYGKHTQAEVIKLHEEGVPGFGPANPVNETSHCRFNDGVVRPDLPAGARLPAWQVGFDVDDDQVDDVIRAAHELGWDVFQPYSSGSEKHHLNFRRKPGRWKLLYHAVFGTWPGRKRGHRKGHPKSPGGVEAEPQSQKPKDKKADTRRGKRTTLGPAIDVSEAQGDVLWKAVAAAHDQLGGDVKCAFIKATEGHDWTDGRFSGARLKAAMGAGLRVGVYHFARPDNNKAADEAKHFIKIVQSAGGKFISLEDWEAGKEGVVAVLDFETAPFSTQWAIGFAKTFKRLTGVEVGLLYGYGSSLNPILGAVRYFGAIWFAAYVSNWKTYLDGHHDKVLFWQNSDNWKCPGVLGDVDHSRYLGGKR